MAIRALIADCDTGLLIEGEGAERGKMGIDLGRLFLVQSELLVAFGRGKGDGDIGGAVLVGDISDLNFVAASLGERGFKSGPAFSIARAFVVQVATFDARGKNGADPVAGFFGSGIIHDHALE